jgi:hypothetical protein
VANGLAGQIPLWIQFTHGGTPRLRHRLRVLGVIRNIASIAKAINEGS